MSSDETTADIANRLRRWAISTDAVPASDLMDEAAAEIDRLRLTDAERLAVRFCVTASLPETEKLGGVAGELCRMHAATLRGLLERTK